MSVRSTLTAEATADATGVATFRFSPIPQSNVQTGVVSIASAPSSAVLTAQVGSSVGGDVWGTWQGNATFGPVQAWAGEVLIVLATGLTPNTRFVARWIGINESEREATPVYPAALATAASNIVASQAKVTPFRFGWTGGAQTSQTSNPIAMDSDTSIVGLAASVGYLPDIADNGGVWIAFTLRGVQTGRTCPFVETVVAVKHGSGDWGVSNLPMSFTVPVGINDMLTQSGGAGLDSTFTIKASLENGTTPMSIVGSIIGTIQLALQGQP